ncbi:MAG: nucleotide-binding universal stress UspA family protein [Alphaproteobacteria bacterium]|jgi:nucleotide-binding universal stress UspA family protein
MITNIIVPTDGSEHAIKACALAGDIASKYGAAVTILHVMLSDASIDQIQGLAKALGAEKKLLKEIDRLIALPMETLAFGGDTVPVMIPVPLEVLTEVGELVTASARKTIAEKGVENISVQIVGGRPADAIIEAVTRTKADMIVMGSRGFGNLKGMLVGSVSHKVSNLSPVTCITVK